MRAMIRPFCEEDFEAVVAVSNVAFPEYPVTPEEMRFHDVNRDPKCRLGRWVAVQDSQVVGSGNYNQSPWMYHPQRFGIRIYVRPEYQRQGIGTALYDTILTALTSLDPLSVRVHVREDWTNAVRFVQKRGFQEGMREWESRLDVGSFDFAPYADVEDSVRVQGIEIKTLRDLEGDPERDRKVYEMEAEIHQDVPHPEPQTMASFEHYQVAVLGDPNVIPEAWFIATQNGQYAGISQLWKSGGHGDLETGLTGVRRDWRRKGIALALKLRALRYAKEVGCATVRTENEANNRAMLSINERLGFVKQPAWVTWTKTFKEE